MKRKSVAVTSEYDLYLKDESKRSGFADEISFPLSTIEVSEIISDCNNRGIPVTVQGARTGVGGGAVPEGGLIMSLEKLKGFEKCDDHLYKAGSGLRLCEIDALLKKADGGPELFPPDPTETTASIGGAASCNSSGARTYGYGPVRNFIEGLTVVLVDGTVLDIKRGDVKAEGRTIEIPGCGKVKLPTYKMPEVKNAAGYYIKDGVDLVDLFIGSEGTLGVITEVLIRTVKRPEHIWGLIAFFEEENRGLDWSDLLRKKFPPLCPDNGLISMEYFDGPSLELLRKGGSNIPTNAGEAVFLEICGDSYASLIETIREIESAILSVGGNPASVFVAGGERMFETFKELRHKTPVMVNERISEIKKSVMAVTKLGSDMSVPVSKFRETVEMYRHDLDKAGLDYVIFGHIGNCHLHCNILSRTEEELENGKELFFKWAERVTEYGGSVCAEHGVGKIKKDYLLLMYGEKAVEEMKSLKKLLDPRKILGQGNIF